MSIRHQLDPLPVPNDILNIEIQKNTFFEIYEIRNCIQENYGQLSSRCFSRLIHTRLIQNLNQHNVQFIVFNLLFKTSRGEQDIQFASEIHKANNVLLQSIQEVRFVGLGIESISVSPPVSPLDKGINSPFTIPKTDISVPRLWTFSNVTRTQKESTKIYIQSSLPITVLQLFILNNHKNTLVQVLSEYYPELTKILIENKNISASPEILQTFSEKSYLAFKSDNEVYEKLLTSLKEKSRYQDRAIKDITALIQLYQDGNSIYLNPYGPSKTIKTIAYQNVDTLIRNTPEVLKDKIVFIGPSVEYGRPVRGGMTNTPYGEISSTELLATSFANIREMNTIKPMEIEVAITQALLWGVLLFLFQSALSERGFIYTILIVICCYLPFVIYFFIKNHSILPWVLVLTQTVICLILASISLYFKQKNKLIDIFNTKLPQELTSVFSPSDFEGVKAGSEQIGICMATDGKGYTRLGKKMGEKWLAEFMVAYQEQVEKCVHQHKGAIKDWAGDGMVALWLEKSANVQEIRFKLFNKPLVHSNDIRTQALLSALLIIKKNNTFTNSRNVDFPLRIGITYGPMWLSFLGELKVFGDTLNAASRLEALNKETQTQILVAEDVIKNQTDFIVRRMGKFLLRGHSDPIEVFELLGVTDALEPNVSIMLNDFEQALSHYENKQLELAHSGFTSILNNFPEDGPSKYYLKKCEYFKMRKNL